MSYELEFEIKGLPPMTNKQSRNSWQARMGEANKWKNLVFRECYGKEPPEPLTKATLTLTRFSSYEPDFDGLVSGFKHVLDGLKVSKIILDDKVSVIGNPQYKWEKVSPRSGKIKVHIKGE